MTVVLCDSSGEVQKLVGSYRTAAQSVGGIVSKIGSLGSTFLAGWHGAAEAMTARELQAIGHFCKRLAGALGDAADALDGYRQALVDAEAALRPTSPLLFTPTQPAFPTFPNTPTLSLQTPAETKALSDLNAKAKTAAAAIVTASELIGKGARNLVDTGIGASLPFQRAYPMVPGPGARVPPVNEPLGPHGNPDVRQVQEVLQARGWDVKVTGKWDDQTVQAVHQFQVNKHLKVTGKVDDATWNAMWTRKIVW
jgi:hypothetical protein